MAAETDGIYEAVALQRQWLRREWSGFRRYGPEPCGANDAFADWAVAVVRGERAARQRRTHTPRPMVSETTGVSSMLSERKTLAQRLNEKRAREASHATA